MNPPTVTRPDSRGQVESSRDEIASRLASINRQINRRIRAKPDILSYGMSSALAAIERSGPLRPADVADAEHVTRPSISRIVSDLDNRGYILRTDDPTDGRSCALSITSAGRQALASARKQRAHDLQALIDGLSDQEVRSIAAALPALEKAARTT